MALPPILYILLFLVQSTTASSCNNEECKDGDEAATEDEVMTFHTNCSHCNSPADTRMKLVGIIPLKSCMQLSVVLNIRLYYGDYTTV